MNDTISRQEAIDALRMDIDIIPFAKAREYARAVIETVYNRLKQLPTVQPERKKGRWIEYPDVLKLADALDDSYIGCSCCENVFNILDNDTERFNYCPNCGADMRGEQDG